MRRAITAVFLLFILGGSARAQEPVVGGKPLSVWLQMLKEPDVPARRSAAAVLATKIAPDSKEAVVPLTEALKDTDRKVRQDVAKAIHKLGPAADSQAVQKLMVDYQKPGESHTCARALGELGRAATIAGPNLVAEITKNSRDRLLQVICARAVVQIDAKATKGVIELLVPSLRDPVKEVRMCAAEGLGDMGPGMASKSSLPLQAALKDNAPEVRVAVARALNKVDRNVLAKSMSILIAVLKDPDVDAATKSTAVEAIGELGIAGKSAIEQLRMAIKDPNPRIRLGIAVALFHLDPKIAATEVAPAIAVALNDVDSNVRLTAIETLRQLTPESIPAILAALKNNGNYSSYTSALAALTRTGEPAVHSLVAVLSDADTVLARAIIEAIGNIGHRAKEAAPALAAVIVDRRKLFLHRFAVASLGKIGGPAAPAVGPLLNSTDARVRFLGVQCAIAMGPEATELLPKLRELARRESEENTRIAADAAVRRLDPGGKS